jgi:nucleotide-binding universal stress UspA family protein
MTPSALARPEVWRTLRHVFILTSSRRGKATTSGPTHAQEVPWEILVQDATPAWRSILDAGDGYDADPIVLGSHGYDFLDRVLGTNAAKVANMAHRDVLAVHRRA